MSQSARSLASRDPRLAALLGIVPRAVSRAPSFGADFGVDFGVDDEAAAHEMGVDFGAEFGGVDLGTEFGFDDYGQDAAVAVAVPPPATHAQLMGVWKAHAAGKMKSASRERLLEPNKGSTLKVERYAFSINQTFTLGVATALSMSGQPDTNIRPQRVSMNAPSPGFGSVSEIKVANVSVTVGGIGDAFEYNANGVGQTLDCPTLSPANRATVLGNYSGFVPPGFVGGSSYLFCTTFKGPASIVA